MCNGTTLEVDESVKTGPYARGVGTANPKAPLHVAGEAIIGPTTGLACDADRKGGLRWNDAQTTIEMCDGVGWKRIAASAPATDFTPDAFSFTDVTDQPLGQLILSNTLTITGMDAGTVASVSGAGTPQISINGGAWVTAGTIDPGQTIQVRLTSDTNVSTARVAVVTVGTVTDNWSVTTKAGSTRIFRTPSTYNGNLGGIGGAHTICQNAAAGLGYGGLWRALLSNSFVNAKDLLTITYPIVRATDGVTVDAINIWDGSIQSTVSPGGGSNNVWTGSDSDGNYSGAACMTWWSSSSANLGEIAYSDATTSAWLSSMTQPCNTTRYLRCVEQAAPIGAKLGITGTGTGLSVFGTGSPALGTARTFTVENAGDTTSATITTSLSNTTNFEFVTDNCNGQTLGQGATCTVSIRAKATFPGDTPGPISGSFTVTANNNPSITLSGYAAAGRTRIFLTSNAYNGNLGGLAGADTTCNNEATTLGYGGTWKALLSDSTTNAKDRLTITYPVVRATDGVIVDSTSIWDGSLQNQVTSDAKGAMTGTGTDGTKDSNGGTFCNDWTTAGGVVIRGDSDSSSSVWIRWMNITYYCSSAWGMYCVEQ